MQIQEYKKIPTYITSIISTSFLILTNVIHGWGSYDAIYTGFIPVLFHNTTDIFISRLWKTDIPMLVHHIMVIFGSLLFYNMKHVPDEVLYMSGWFIMAEISSFFNSVRFFYRRTPYQIYADALFGFSFLIIRSISTVGTIQFLIRNYMCPYYIPMCIITFMYASLNILWSYKIVIESQRISRSMSTLIHPQSNPTSKRERLKCV